MKNSGRILLSLPVVRHLRETREALRMLLRDAAAIRALKEREDKRAADAYIRSLLSSERYADPRSLNRHERQVFSQNGEDGMVDEIFRRIGTTDRRFVEVGVQDGLITNTTYLLSVGWSGVWIDAAKQLLDRATRHFHAPIAQDRLRIVNAFITAENIAETFRSAGVTPEFDFLSLDIDRNTYFAWRALSGFRPRVVAVEYNATIPPRDVWCVEYAADKSWNRTAYFGASLKAYEQLGAEFGYSLVGCELSGTNAFFVRNDLLGDHFFPPFTSEHHYEPPRYWLYSRAGHARCFSD